MRLIRILAEMASQVPMLRSVQVIKQEADDLGLQRQDIAYVKQQQTLDREERATWRDAQKRQASDSNPPPLI